MVTILNRWLSKPIKQTLRTNYDSNPLSGIIEMHCVESVPQSRLNNENLFLYNFIVFLSSLNVQRILLSLSLFFFSLGVAEGKGARYFSRIFEKGCELIKKNKRFTCKNIFSFKQNKSLPMKFYNYFRKSFFLLL